jgi:hypothetical protein
VFRATSAIAALEAVATINRARALASNLASIDSTPNASLAPAPQQNSSTEPVHPATSTLSTTSQQQTPVRTSGIGYENVHLRAEPIKPETTEAPSVIITSPFDNLSDASASVDAPTSETASAVGSHDSHPTESQPVIEVKSDESAIATAASVQVSTSDALPEQLAEESVKVQHNEAEHKPEAIEAQQPGSTIFFFC